MPNHKIFDLSIRGRGANRSLLFRENESFCSTEIDIRCQNELTIFIGISKRWRLTWLKETVFEPTGEGPVLMRLRVDRGMSWKEFQEFVAKYKHDKFNDEDPVYSKNGDEIKAFFPIETSGYDADEQKCQMVNHFCTYSPLDQIEVTVT